MKTKSQIIKLSNFFDMILKNKIFHQVLSNLGHPVRNDKLPREVCTLYRLKITQMYSFVHFSIVGSCRSQLLKCVLMINAMLNIVL